MSNNKSQESEDSVKGSEKVSREDRKKRIGKRKGTKSEVPVFLQTMYSMIEAG